MTSKVLKVLMRRLLEENPTIKVKTSDGQTTMLKICITKANGRVYVKLGDVIAVMTLDDAERFFVRVLRYIHYARIASQIVSFSDLWDAYEGGGEEEEDVEEERTSKRRKTSKKKESTEEKGGELEMV